MSAPADGLPDACEAAVEAFGLSIEAVEVDDNPHMPQDRDGMRHWECVLSGDAGASVTFHVSLADGLGAAPPSPAFALSLLLADVGLYRSCEGFEEFAASIGAGDGDASAAAAWSEIGRVDAALSAALGADAVESLVAGETPSVSGPTLR